MRYRPAQVSAHHPCRSRPANRMLIAPALENLSAFPSFPARRSRAEHAAFVFPSGSDSEITAY